MTALTAEQRARKAVYEAARKLRLRTEAVAAYGGKCACCGEDRLEFLQLDHHTSLTGSAHRAEVRRNWSQKATWAPGGSGAGQNTYAWLRRNGYPPIVQVLCANCNFAKSMDKERKCPHEG